MLPPLRVTTMGPGDEANTWGCCSSAAQAMLPAGSTTTLLRVSKRRMAWHIDSSDTVRISSTHFDLLVTSTMRRIHKKNTHTLAHEHAHAPDHTKCEISWNADADAVGDGVHFLQLRGLAGCKRRWEGSSTLGLHADDSNFGLQGALQKETLKRTAGLHLH